MTVQQWLPAAEISELTAGEIHIWRIALNRSPQELALLEPLLSPDERARGSRFHFERHRQEFTAHRGILRSLLARYLGQSPGSLTFEYGKQGKPSVAGTELKFNLSHSGGVALVAIARERELGVDVEQHREQVACLQIAQRFCSAGEYAALITLPQDQQRAAFFDVWARKESFIKAVGLGLSCPLDSFEVTLGPAPRLTILRHVAEPRRDWSLVELQVGTGFAAALTVEGDGCPVRCWEWPAHSV